MYQNAALDEARSSDTSAQANPQIATGQAQAVANAETEITNPVAEREKAQIQARMREIEQTRRQAALARQSTEQARQQAVIAQASADQTVAEWAAAKVDAAQDKARMNQLQEQLDGLHVTKTGRGLVITLDDVLFGVNKTQLKSGGMRNVQKLADFLKQYPQRKVLIKGFTDSPDSDSSNQLLSEQRANAVRTTLIEMGISGDRVAMPGSGKTFPMASNANPDGRQLNRRVEIILSDDNGNIAPR